MEKTVILKDGSALEISRPGAADAAELLDYLKIIGGETHFLLFGEQGLAITVEQEAEIMERHAKQTRGGFHMGCINGEVACTFNLSCYSKQRLAHVGEVALAVKKKFWHLGVGSAIMETLIELAKEAGLSNIELGCYADNVRAHALYERYGFVDIGRHKGRFMVDGVYYDEILMDLYLTKDETREGENG